MADEKFFDLEIISPERTFYKGQASFLELTTSEGEVGIYKNHVPMTNVVVPGIVTIHEADGVKEAAVHSGFMVILQDSIKIMAEVAEWPEEIDENRANEARIRAERRLKEGGSGIDTVRAEAALKRSLTRLNLVGK
ncbi:MAG: ATP synthase F1 subunit epsilon [Lachnospiraceae bacterium]|nr:ATP synthase F1 subunit epsilon [Lachnospiraceae bacterium]